MFPFNAAIINGVCPIAFFLFTKDVEPNLGTHLLQICLTDSISPLKAAS
jgi:hypothetical protein